MLRDKTERVRGLVRWPWEGKPVLFPFPHYKTVTEGGAETRDNIHPKKNIHFNSERT